MTTAIQSAQAAASAAFEKFLGPRSTAAMSVPECVVRAARTAYAQAGGRSGIRVFGHGNRTHPVIGVIVRTDRSRAAKEELAAALRSYAAEIDAEYQ